MTIAMLILAATAAQPLHSHGHGGLRPQPVGNPAQWITEADYPAIALIERREGTVAFSLSVDASGAPTACEIRRSSGFASLDEATCAILMRKAKFRPVKGADGRAYGGIFSSKVRWLTPDNAVGSTGPVTASVFRDDDDMMDFARGR